MLVFVFSSLPSIFLFFFIFLHLLSSLLHLVSFCFLLYVSFFLLFSSLLLFSRFFLFLLFPSLILPCFLTLSFYFIFPQQHLPFFITIVILRWCSSCFLDIFLVRLPRLVHHHLILFIASHPLPLLLPPLLPLELTNTVTASQTSRHTETQTPRHTHSPRILVILSSAPHQRSGFALRWCVVVLWSSRLP